MSETYPGQMLPELQEKTTVDSNDLFYMVSSNASKKIKGSNLKDQMKPSDYTGATSSTNGANGLVPQPTTSDVDRFLKGDGTWGDISYAVGEASGSIASFSDGSPLPMRSLKAYIEPVQDLHGYDVPWVGGAGKNKLPLSNDYTDTKNNITITVKNGILYVNGTSNVSTTDFYFSMFTLEAGTYVFSATKSGTATNLFLKIGNNYINEGQTFTLNEDSNCSAFLRCYEATYNNASAACMIRLASVTDATFAPYSNICPISGWTACNVNNAKAYQLCISEDSSSVTENGLTMTYEGNGKYRVKGSLSTNTTTRLILPIESFDIYNGTDSYVKFNNTFGDGNFNLLFLKDSTIVDGWSLVSVNRETTFSGMRGKNINKVCVELMHGLYGTSLDFTFKVEILSNSTANLNTYTIQFTDGSNPLTVYGGYVDIVSGLLVVDRMLVDMGTLNWSIVSWQGVNYIVSQTIRNVCVKPSSDNIKGNILCSNYPNIPRSSISTTTDKIISLDSNGNINAIDSNYATASDFTTAMNGVQLVYELATPQTYQLTAQQVKSLLGENRVWADTGDVDVHYVRDLTITIDDILSRLEALEG